MNDFINPGFYEKVRLDQHGKVLDAGHLEAKDLPPHTHSMRDLDEEEIQQKVIETLSTIFANSESSAVIFDWDPITKTVSADVNIDDTSITKNEYGQLIGCSSTVSEGSDLNLDDILEAINPHFERLEKEIKEDISNMFVDDTGDSVVFDLDKTTNTISADVKIDGVTIVKNEFGQLCVAIGTGGELSPVNTGCANHTHTHNDIEDFTDAVKNLFDQWALALNVDISNYIDNETIILNEYGKISSVSNIVKNHTHHMIDIIDYVAPEAAARQAMSDLGEDVLYDLGVIDFKELNIGYSILALSQYIKDVVLKKISKINELLAEFELNNGGNGIGSVLKIDPNSISNDLYDKTSKVYRRVYYTNALWLLLDYLPKTSGIMKLLLNDTVVDTCNVESLQYVGSTVGGFSVQRTYVKGIGVGKVIRINMANYIQSEGIFNVRIEFESTEGIKDSLPSLTLITSPYKSLPYKIEDVTKNHRIGRNDYYDVPTVYRYRVSIENYSNYRFINDTAGFKNGWFEHDYVGDVDISVPNLFESTNLSLHFNLIPEVSKSELYQHVLDIRNSTIVNDVWIPNNSIAEAIFEIPRSEKYNSIRFWGIDNDAFTITKGDRVAEARTSAEYPDHAGRIFNEADYKLLSFLDSYDDGKSKMRLHLKGGNQVNLAQVYFELENI